MEYPRRWIDELLYRCPFRIPLLTLKKNNIVQTPRRSVLMDCNTSVSDLIRRRARKRKTGGFDSERPGRPASS